MTKTANINVLIVPETKAEAKKLFASFGITLTDAINIFLHKSIMEGTLLFEMKQLWYNAETETAMQKAREIMNGDIFTEIYSFASELFAELYAEMDGK